MNLYFCSLPFYVLSFCNTIVARFTYYFAVYEIFLIPQLLNILIKKKSKAKVQACTLHVLYFCKCKKNENILLFIDNCAIFAYRLSINFYRI